MNLLLSILSFLHLTLCSLEAMNDFPSEPLKDKLKIVTEPVEIAGTAAQSIVSFSQNNRNHHSDRNGKHAQFIILNHTHSDFFRTMDIYTKDIDKDRVSAHYVITQPESDKGIQGGLLYSIVPEQRAAWFTGVSSWGNIQNLNDHSIGISLINKGYEENSDQSKTWYTFNQQQIDTLGKLCVHLIQKYNIPAFQILGRGDIAPYRVEGPGIVFPWGDLHTKYGVGAWLTEKERDPTFIINNFNPQKTLPANVDKEFFLGCLKNLGYNIEDRMTDEQTKKIIKIFKSHFSCNQSIDAYESALDENDMIWAWGLEAKYKPKLLSKL